MTFTNAVRNQMARTENGMRAHKSTSDAVVDFFFKAGAMRGQDIVPTFVGAFAQERELALRAAQWLRDVRGGAGERQLFRDILAYLANTDLNAARALMDKVPELGRWDDLFSLVGTQLESEAFDLIAHGLETENGLCAKWMPRKGPISIKLRQYFGLTPKQYRKMLVGMTNVVETKMCANQWDSIEFGKLPSLAAARYRAAFKRRVPEKFTTFVEKVQKGEEKINTGAVYPYDVLKNVVCSYGMPILSKVEKDFIIEQWKALPNFVGDANVLPLVDVSGSMEGHRVNETVTALHVAVGLGLYFADKNTGPFNGTFLTFSGSPELLNLTGNIIQKVEQMTTSNWSMNTNLHAAFSKILETAVRGHVSQEDMPEVLLILSDMQFDQCVRYDDRAIDMIRRKYEAAGYKMPQVVFWNLAARSNVPVSANEHGVALVSGFSPAIAKAVLKADLEEFTPRAIMLQTLMQPRYDIA